MRPTVYYNDNDRFCCQWIEYLGRHDLIPPGDVDRDSIVDMRPIDVRDYDQCHFFAGIGGWAYALKLAGWPEGRRVWTGSCPCQPFSIVGSRKGEEDKRHFWPYWYDIIKEYMPPTIFGEQVASPLGRRWLTGVRADLEDLGYAVGAADLCAASVSAPHIRQRLFWVANTDYRKGRAGKLCQEETARSYKKRGVRSSVSSKARRAGHTKRTRLAGHSGDVRRETVHRRTRKETARPVVETDQARVRRFWDRYEICTCEDGQRRVEPGTKPMANGIPARVGRVRGYGNAIVPEVAAEFIKAFLEAEEEIA